MSSFIKRIINYFFLISKDDPVELRKRKVLNILLLGIEFIDGLIILSYLIFLITGSPLEGIGRVIHILRLSIFAFIGGIIIFYINNYLSYKIADIIFLLLITFLIYLSDTLYELVLGRSLIQLVLPIIIAGILIKPYASFIVAFFIILVNLFICSTQDFFPSPISYTILILIAFITWFSIINFEKSIEKYREAYKRESFYRDLFAHDTSNILQNILMALEIYEQKLETSRKLNEKESLNLIKAQIDRGANLVENVRKFGIFSESKRFLKKVDCIKVLKEAIENIKSSRERKELKTHIETLIQNNSVMANKFLLDVFETILNNSVIHNDNAIVEIFIRISNIQEEKKRFLKVEIIDNGVGIPDSIKQYVFNREINGDKSVIGLGLGLLLVRSILEQYKAKIWVEDKVRGEYSKGSNFILIFPEVS